jgi:hypothetical protein
MNTYQHNDSSYNNGIHPVLPSYNSSNNSTNRSSGYAMPSNLLQYRSNSTNSVCPVAVTTYATLHLDTIHKLLNHILYVTIACDIIVFLSSFSISYFNNVGYNTVLCTFLLCTITVVTLLIINNNRISALSILAPTEYMIGVATGITLSAIVISLLLCSTYKSTIKLCHEIIQSSSSFSTSHSTTTSNNNSTHSDNAVPDYSNDAILLDACRNHTSTMSSIRFWSSLIGWCNVVLAALLMIGRHELSAHTTRLTSNSGSTGPYSYDPIPTTSTTTAPTTNGNEYPPGYDFEEQFRQQQAEILGSQGVAAIRDRITSTTTTAMFVGDYSTIPEVAQHQPQQSVNTSKNNNGPQILSV